MMLDPLKALRKVKVTYGKTSRRTVNAFVYNCISCGAEITVNSGKLRCSVGLCYKCSSAYGRRNIPKLRPFEWCYRRILRSAKERRIDVHLTYEEYLRFTEIPDCHYCKNSIYWRPHNNDVNKTAGTWLDRKDNGQGYVMGNLVVACGMCNRIKNNHLSYEEMLRIGVTLQQISADRKGR